MKSEKYICGVCEKQFNFNKAQELNLKCGVDTCVGVLTMFFQINESINLEKEEDTKPSIEEGNNKYKFTQQEYTDDEYYNETIHQNDIERAKALTNDVIDSFLYEIFYNDDYFHSIVVDDVEHSAGKTVIIIDNENYLIVDIMKAQSNKTFFILQKQEESKQNKIVSYRDFDNNRNLKYLLFTDRLINNLEVDIKKYLIPYKYFKISKRKIKKTEYQKIKKPEIVSEIEKTREKPSIHYLDFEWHLLDLGYGKYEATRKIDEFLKENNLSFFSDGISKKDFKKFKKSIKKS